MSITAWVIVAVVVVCVIWAVSAYNGRSGMRRRLSQALSDIAVQLKQRRAPLAPSPSSLKRDAYDVETYLTHLALQDLKAASDLLRGSHPRI